MILSDYLYRKASQKRVPLFGTFELSPVCNFACKMCYVRKTPAQIRQEGKELIPAEKWREDPRPPKNHILLRDTLMLGVDDFTGQPGQRYTLRYTGPPKGEKDCA